MGYSPWGGKEAVTTEPSEKSMNCVEGRCNSPLNRNDGKSQKRKHELLLDQEWFGKVQGRVWKG